MASGAVATGLVAMGAAIGGGIDDGILIEHTVDSIAHQPELQSRLQATMFIGVGLIEAMPTIVIATGFLVMNK